jgi:hypothetical protein
MVAEVTQINGSPDKIAEAVRRYYTDTVAVAVEQPGVGGGYLLADRAAGRLLVVDTWASEADLRSAAGALAPAVNRLMEAAGASAAPIVEHFEVVGQASGNLTARPG